MQIIKKEVIQFGLHLRQQGKIVDRAAYSIHYELDQLAECMQIWQHYLTTPIEEVKSLLDNRLSQQLTHGLDQILMDLENHQIKQQKEFETKLEAIHLEYAEQHSLSFTQQSDLIKQIRSLELTLQNHKKQAEKTQLEFDALYAQAEQSRHLIDQKEEENRGLWRKLEELTAERDEQKVQIADAIVNGKQGQQGIKRQYQQQEIDLYAQLKQKEQLISEQNQHIRTEEQQQQQLKNQLILIEEKHLHETQKLSAELLHKETILAEQAQQIKQLQQSNGLLEKQLNQLEHNHNLLTKDSKLQIDDLTNKMHDLLNNSSEKVSQWKQLESSYLNKIESLHKENKALEINLNKTSASLLEQEAQNKQQQNQSQHLLEQVEQNNQRELEQKLYQLQDLNKQYSKAEDKIERLQQELNQQINLFGVAQQELNLKITEQNKYIHQLQAQIADNKQTLQAQQLIESNLQDDAKLLQNRLLQQQEKHQRESENARNTIKLLRDELNQLQESHAQSQHENQEQLTVYKLKFEYAEQQLKQLRQTEQL